MKVPLKKLRNHVDTERSVRELADRLTMAGVEVGDVAEIGGWNEVYVGQVTLVRPHPDSDRHQLCTVTTGNQDPDVEVVCEAPNVTEGQKVCLSRAGALLHHSGENRHRTLPNVPMEGAKSRGVICSVSDLGLGNDTSRIIVLPGDAPLGHLLDDYMGDYLNDTVIQLDLTPNRPDCMSILGVAREVAAMEGASVREAGFSYEESGTPVEERVSVTIEHPELCPRYTAAIIDGITIAESPRWLQGELLRLGHRPINNVVDAARLVELEYGQPLHAFDYDMLADTKVIVRRAHGGELMTTLDGEYLELGPENLVIADPRGPVALAGIIGGARSAIGPATTTVLLESATFDPINNRTTARSMGLRTEATLRFEKGLRPELAVVALRRAVTLVQEVAGGRVAPGIIDVLPDPSVSPLIVNLSARRLRRVLGIEMDLEQIRATLDSRSLSSQSAGYETLDVTVPYWRSDLNIEEDLIEEVVRTTGYNEVPSVMLSAPIPHRFPIPLLAMRDRMKDLLAAGGMQEVITYPLVSDGDLERVRQMDSDDPPLRVANPMSKRHEYLRPTLQAGLIRTLASNQRHGNSPLHLFETGRVFRRRNGNLPDEQEIVAGVMTGRRREVSWLARDGTVDFYDAKGVVEWTLGRLEVDAHYEHGSHPTYAPGRCAVVRAGDVLLGYVGELHPAVRELAGLNTEIAVGFELYLVPLLDALPRNGRQIASLPRFPEATRDLSLESPTDMPAGRVTEIIQEHTLVEQALLTEVYSGERIDEGHRGLNFHIRFRAPDRTLTNDEVQRHMDLITEALKRQARTTLRG